jgi:predicted membrane channel-forming protein YqfA (hemolysin III family)
MILSSLYHTFSCRSAKAYDCFLAYDLFGIALSLLAIYISGIYYAFWCNDVSVCVNDDIGCSLL